ncbi:PrgI family protein [Patescibacteria group bacterium]|nr:PrgI family protein [Patescibacteria group bacterium]MBU1895299.1 PrgI family protein [Patescibacteria group bacterium]
MQQFVVPQFIDVEDKIFGPITVRQFLILLATGIILFIVYKLADFALFVILTAIIGGSSLVVAFVKINGQTFHYFLLNLLETKVRPKQRVWNKTLDKKELDMLRKAGMDGEPDVVMEKKTAERRHIRDLSLIVNTGGYYRGEDDL